MPRGRINPREADRMMKRMGMQVTQLDDVTLVIMEGPTRRIIIEGPEGATVTVQGQTIYQVGGGSVRTESVAVQTSVEDASLVAGQAGGSREEGTYALEGTGGGPAAASCLL